MSGGEIETLLVDSLSLAYVRVEAGVLGKNFKTRRWRGDLIRISFVGDSLIDRGYRSSKPGKGRDGCRWICSQSVEKTKSGAESAKLTQPQCGVWLKSH